MFLFELPKFIIAVHSPELYAAGQLGNKQNKLAMNGVSTAYQIVLKDYLFKVDSRC